MSRLHVVVLVCSVVVVILLSFARQIEQLAVRTSQARVSSHRSFQASPNRNHGWLQTVVATGLRMVQPAQDEEKSAARSQSVGQATSSLNTSQLGLLHAMRTGMASGENESGVNGSQHASLQDPSAVLFHALYAGRRRNNKVDKALDFLVRRWSPNIELQHHNLRTADMDKYNITCIPKVWLLLSGLYRSLRYVRSTMLDMLRRSAGDCWFVTLLASGNRGYDLAIFKDDFRFFEGRLGYVSLIRHGLAVKEKRYNYAIHWFGCWLIAHIIQQALPNATIGDPFRTIVVRHRPDECFRACFDADAAAAVFETWRYMILGQPISADNGLTTNWATYTDIIASGLGMQGQPNVVPGTVAAANAASWATSEYCHGHVRPDKCGGYVPYCQENNNTPPCKPPIFVGHGWEQHCLCRLKHENNLVSGGAWCINKKQPNATLQNNGICLDITKGTKCMLPLHNWSKIPERLRPPPEQLDGGLKKVLIPWMKPDAGFLMCNRGRDL